MNAEYTGKQIAELRKAKNMTQKELAVQLHVTDKAVSKWECGMNFPDLGLMEHLAEVLDTTPSHLLGIEDASKEEIVSSFTEISSQQAEEASKDIQKIGWVNLFAGLFLVILMYFINITLQRNGLYFASESVLWLIYGMIAVVLVGAVYTLYKYKAIGKWETMDIVLTEMLVVDVVVFFGIQLFTGRNPHEVVTLILFGIGSVCLQLLFYRIMKPHFIKALPLMLAVLWVCWGILLKAASSSWVNTSIWNWLIFYIAPAVFCLVTWLICRKRDDMKEQILPSRKSVLIGLVIVVVFISLFCQSLLAKTYVKVFHKHLETYAEELLAECENVTTESENVYISDNGEIHLTDKYGFWKVTCYPEDELVEFHTGGAGLVPNSAYLGFYYSPDNTHKTFQGVDIPLNVNDNLADWYGEGDNWGKSIRLLENWFWFEAYF